jgi:hypothetical protein
MGEITQYSIKPENCQTVDEKRAEATRTWIERGVVSREYIDSVLGSQEKTFSTRVEDPDEPTTAYQSA